MGANIALLQLQYYCTVSFDRKLPIDEQSICPTVCVLRVTQLYTDGSTMIEYFNYEEVTLVTLIIVILCSAMYCFCILYVLLYSVYE